MAILRGNLAPRGAVIKQGAAAAKLMQHEGRAVVFDSVADMTKRIDDPALDVTENDILVMRNAGPVGAPGMPEAGYIPIPKKLAQKGIKDMVRISDARMSGTAFGTIVLHIAPEAAVGGPLALVNNGDRIRLDVNARTDRPAGRRGGIEKTQGCVDGAAGSGRRAARLCPALSRACRSRPTKAAISISCAPGRLELSSLLRCYRC